MHDPTTKEYVFAKAHGMWASSFVSGRVAEIRNAKSVGDLYRVVFQEDPPLIPEASLTDLIEEKLTVRTIEHYTKLLSFYDRSYDLLNFLLYEYELINLKVAMSQLREKNEDTSFIIDIGSYSPLKWDAWPSLKDVTRGSLFSFFSDVVSIDRQLEKEMELDSAYYKAMWNALYSLSEDDYEACNKLVTKEFLLHNLVWVLRLRFYYGFRDEQLEKYLLGNWDEKSRRILCEPCYFAFEASLDDREAWEDWKFEWLINPYQENEEWKLDPRYAQSVADRYLYNLALRNFHNGNNPVSLLFSFFKLKRGEEYFIRQELEKLKVGKNMPFESVMEDKGVENA
ncbi:MAG: V0D/AC39 family V-type ATPase subunit [Treponema sp.]